MREKSLWKPFLAMFLGLSAVCTAAIFIRLAQAENASSLLIATGRLAVASLILIPVALQRHMPEIRTLTQRDWLFITLSGFMLGIHFAAWITSLEYTSVVNSVALVTTSPLWVALFAPIFLGEQLRQQTFIGLGLAFGGGLMMALSNTSGEAPISDQPLLGNLLAVGGAIAVAFYFIIGRQLRGHLSIITYSTIVYSIAAFMLLFVIGLIGQLGEVLDLTPEAWLWIVLLGVVPQLIGHSSFNYALGFLPAGYVSLIVLAEPVGSGLLAFIFLDETPVLLQLIGAAFILSGIFLATREQMRFVPDTETTIVPT
ncbi:MAG: EamA family transporter [Phototrophicales bacterium]|nr:MAG: EamA family transporter [Phototrophicales bacterium]